MLRYNPKNEGELEGKVLIYAKVTGMDGSEICGGCPKVDDCKEKGKMSIGDFYIGIYFTDDKADFEEKMMFPPELTNGLADMLDEFREEELGEGAKQLVPVYPVPIIARERQVLDNFLEQADELYVGEASSMRDTFDLIMQASNFYELVHNTYFKRKFGVQGIEEQNGKSLTHKDIEKGKLRDYMVKEFVTPMLDANAYGRKEDLCDTRKKLIKFAAGAPYVRDVLALSEELRKNDFDLIAIELHLRKISALHQEDFEQAAKIRDQIKSHQEH